jgi:citrate synthase
MLNIDGKSYLNVREASERLGVKPETLYAYVSRGLINSYRQGIRRQRLYLLNEVESLLALRPSAAEEPPAAQQEIPAPPPAPVAPSTQDRSQLPRADEWATER